MDEMQKPTPKFEGVPEPFFPKQVYFRLALLVEFFRIAHLFCFFVTGAEQMCDLDRAFKILDVDALLLCQQFVDLSSPQDVVNPRQCENDTRKYR